MSSVFVFKIRSSPQFPIDLSEWQVPLQGGVIGRAKECEWSLDDASRVISRQHARVEIENDHCFWTDLGTNSTLVNGKPMPNAQRTRVNFGDLLKIGEYLIVLEQVSPNWSGLDALKPDSAVDPLFSLFLRPEAAINIDDLLEDSVPSIPSPLFDNTPEVPVLAHRMYVGLQRADHMAAKQKPPVLDPDLYEKELAELRCLLRISVQGLMQMLQARRLFKTELGGDLTTLSSKGNNPLKFARSVDDALSLLKGVQSPGYLPAEAALEEAFQDVLTHMQLSISQTQLVIDQVHRALDPLLISDELERTQVSNRAGFNLAGLGSGSAATRKARLWDLYCERYKQLRDSWS